MRDGTADLDTLVTAGQRTRAVEDALAHVREERDTTHSRFQEACAVLRHDTELVEVGSKQEPSQGMTR